MTDPAAARPVEVELKYRVLDPAAAERYLTADGDRAVHGADRGRARPQLEDRYVDTADGPFARAGFAVRLRAIRRRRRSCRSSRSPRPTAGGSVSRGGARGTGRPDAAPADWPASDARSLVLELAGDARSSRSSRSASSAASESFRAADTRVELSLDEVDVVAGDRVVDRFVELEAEVMEGDDGRARRAGRRSSRRTALEPSGTSKFEAAQAALATGRPQTATGAARCRGPRTAHRADPDDDADERPAMPEDAPVDTRAAAPSARHPALPPTTTSPRRAARSSASTLPGCWPARRARDGRRSARPPRDARRDTAAARGVARLRRLLSAEADEALPDGPPRGGRAARRRARP